MSILRIKKQSNYTVISNALLNDERLSFKARGLAAYLLSKPDDWQISREHLAKCGPDKVDAIRTALKELEALGYLTRRRFNKPDGTLGWESILHEQPLHENPPMVWVIPCQPLVDKPSVDKPSVDKPSVENPRLLSTDVVNTDLPSTDIPKSVEVDNLVEPTQPAPSPVNAFGTNLADERIIHEDPPAGPKAKADFDPRQLRNGLWPKDTGQTAYEVYREVFATIPSNYQIEHMTANATDLAKWREITQKCALKGFRSYDNVFDVYQNGFKPQKGQSRHDRRSNAPAEQSAPGHARPDLYAKYGWETSPAT